MNSILAEYFFCMEVVLSQSFFSQKSLLIRKTSIRSEDKNSLRYKFFHGDN
jgi:hypothetical protein